MPQDAVLLVAYGGPRRPEEIMPFLERVTAGRRIPRARLEEVAHHYEKIGGRSPLNALTAKQAEGVRRALGLPVYVGMRLWEPSLAGTLAQMALDGVRRAATIILAPHACDSSRERYVEAIDAARATAGPRAPEIRHVHDWYLHPDFIAAWTERLEEAFATLPADVRRATPLVFTAHSIPVASAEEAPYEAQIRATAEQLALQLGHERWELAWQSRSGRPEDPWLEPDVNVTVRRLAAEGARRVVLAPIGFVCDHVEVLYDLDVEARATADAAGIGYVRAAAPNDHPRFVRMLADLARERLA
jgi:ferrochelatase